MNNTKKQGILSSQALDLLELIIEQKIETINYKNPGKQIKKILEKSRLSSKALEQTPEDKFEGLLKEISTTNPFVMQPKVGFSIRNYEFGTKYHIDSDEAKNFYESELLKKSKITSI